MRIKLSQNNYYTVNNTYLSNSKIGDFIKDKAYFKQRHIDKTLGFEQTRPMIIGHGVDTLLTEGTKSFNAQYQCKALKKEDPELFEAQKKFEGRIITNDMMDLMLSIVKSVESQSAYKELKDYETQPILQMDTAWPGPWSGLCGMLDYLKVDGELAIIVDLKTVADISPKKYRYKVEDFSYARQLSMYSKLVKHNYPKVKRVECYHLIVQSSHPFHCLTYKFPKQMIDAAEANLDLLIDAVVAEKEFKSPDCSFNTAISLGE